MAQLHDLLKEIEPVHSGHFDVQRDDIGIELLDRRATLRGIAGGSDDLDVRLAGQVGLQDRPHGGGIVDDKDTDRHAALF